jgi:hypothetical protein
MKVRLSVIGASGWIMQHDFRPEIERFEEVKLVLYPFRFLALCVREYPGIQMRKDL